MDNTKRTRKEIDQDLAQALMRLGELTYSHLANEANLAAQVSALVNERNASAPGAEFVKPSQPANMEPMKEEASDATVQAEASAPSPDAA